MRARCRSQPSGGLGPLGRRLFATFAVVAPASAALLTAAALVGTLEPVIRAVTIIPAATEFGYDPVPRVRVVSPGTTDHENAHLYSNVSDWTVSLDELQALCPNLQHVSLVVAWFGDDLDAGSCTIAPRVETATRTVDGTDWAASGLSRGTARGVSFCTHTVMSNELLVVEDASRDPRFADSFLVTGYQGIRFYAGAPLEVAPGLQVGSLCVIDRVPRTFTDRQRGQLQTLARIVTAQLRLHKTERLLREREASYRLLADNTTDMVVRADLDGTRRYVSPGCWALLGYEPEALIGTRCQTALNFDPGSASNFDPSGVCAPTPLIRPA